MNSNNSNYQREREFQNAHEELNSGIIGMAICIAISLVFLYLSNEVPALKLLSIFFFFVSMGFIFDIRRGRQYLKELKQKYPD